MPTPLPIRTAFWLWMIGVIAVGQFGWLHRMPPAAWLLIPVGLTGLQVLAYRTIAGFRGWVDALDLRGLVLLNFSRIAGLYLLALSRRGELPYTFSLPSGVGEIAVAIAAVLVALWPFAEATRRRAIYIWNVAGTIDIALIAVTALRVGYGAPRELISFGHLPLSLLPTFLAPLLIATHLAIFARLRPDNR